MLIFGLFILTALAQAGSPATAEPMDCSAEEAPNGNPGSCSCPPLYSYRWQNPSGCYHTGALTPWDELAPTVRDTAARYMTRSKYNGLTLAQRISSACVMHKLQEMEYDGFPKVIPGLGNLTSIEPDGMLKFEVSGSDAPLQSELLKLKYTPANGAGWQRPWGLRNPLIGPQLHFRREDGVVNVHIDLKNPGATEDDGINIPMVGSGNLAGLEHRDFDKTNRIANYTPAALLAADQRACGVGKSDLLLVALDAPKALADNFEALAAKSDRPGFSPIAKKEIATASAVEDDAQLPPKIILPNPAPAAEAAPKEKKKINAH